MTRAASTKERRVERLQAELAQGRARHIGEVSRLLGVSEMTVRRDIQQNPDKFGFLGGYVVPSAVVSQEGPYSLESAGDLQRDAKRKACEIAVAYIKPGETVFIDCGTTLIELVDLIPDDMPITVVCYALNVGARLASKPNVTLVMLGGVYHPSSATFSGPEGLATISSLGINLALLSAAGYDPARGATCAHSHEAEIKRRVISTASRKILVIDTSKLGRLRPFLFAESDAFDGIVTELGAAVPGETQL